VKTSPTESPFMHANKLNAALGTESKYPLIGQKRQTPSNVNAKKTGSPPIITFVTSGIASANVRDITV
jgi:hypothetical protein